MKYVLAAILLLAPVCLAQECAIEDHPRTDSAVAYIGAEIKALYSIRQALAEEMKIPAPAPPGDPMRPQKAALRNTIAKSLSKYFDCAARIIAPYKESNDKKVQGSAETFLTGIERSRNVNEQVLEQLEVVDKAESKDAVDPEIMRRLVQFTKIEDDARSLIVLGVKMSTYTIVREKVEDEETKPFAFTITPKEHQVLLKNVQDLKKTALAGQRNYVDDCTDELFTALNQKLPMEAEIAPPKVQ